MNSSHKSMRAHTSQWSVSTQTTDMVYKNLQVKKLESNQLLKSHITKFFKLWARNQWKRERIAPAFHLDEFNVDPRTWCRFPILSSGFVEELKELEEMD